MISHVVILLVQFGITGRQFMSEIIDNADLVSYWFVGAMWDYNDETARFLDNGIWENGYDDRFIDLVKICKSRR